jgi:hypothetical protein
MIKFFFLSMTFFAVFFVLTSGAIAGGKEDFNDCRTATGDYCERAGSCAIQGSAWYQYVQGTCFPLGAQDDITAHLSDNSFAEVPSISGSLSCGGDSGGDSPGDAEICDDGIDNDNDGKTDCSDKNCKRDSFCRRR